MAETGIKIEGLEITLENIERYGVKVENDFKTLVKGTAQEIRTKAIKKIQRGEKTGRIYEKYLPRRSHQASAPGEPPATDTGRLAASIEAEVSGMSGAVGTGLDYGKYLEFGTTKMKARPWLTPSVEEQRPDWNRRIVKLINDAVKN